MLFLGAGASKPFGIPTMQDFTAEMPKVLRDDEAAEINRILADLKDFGFKKADIESVMDVLTAREDLFQAWHSIGPRIIEFSEGTINRAYNVKANVLLERIREQIEARCSKANFQQSDAHYERFFREVPSSSRLVGDIPTVFRQIFTTNYDLCIDRFLRMHGYEDGFEEKAGYGRVFTANWSQAEETTYTLCKLHGSINWFEVGGRIIQSQFPFVSGQSLMDEQVTGRMMVYPASEKYALTSPYAECLFYLRRSLMTERRDPVVVVVGYSFRDAPINNAFVDAIKVNPNLRIVSLGPHATTHQYELEDPLRSRIMSIDGDFASSKSLDALKNAISSNRVHIGVV